MSYDAKTPCPKDLERAQHFGRIRTQWPEFLERAQHFGSINEGSKNRSRISGPPQNFCMIRNNLSRISGTCTFFHHDPKYRVKKIWNVHSISVGSETQCPEFLERAQHFGRIIEGSKKLVLNFWTTAEFLYDQK
jgi:hypothetical protein